MSPPLYIWWHASLVSCSVRCLSSSCWDRIKPRSGFGASINLGDFCVYGDSKRADDAARYVAMGAHNTTLCQLQHTQARSLVSQGVRSISEGRCSSRKLRREREGKRDDEQSRQFFNQERLVCSSFFSSPCSKYTNAATKYLIMDFFTAL